MVRKMLDRAATFGLYVMLLVSATAIVRNVAGCSDVGRAVEQTRNVLVRADQEAETAVTILEEQRDLLPEGSPEREQITKVIEQAKEFRRQAAERLAQADAFLTDLQNGTISPATREAMLGIPYGGYVFFALSSAVALQRHYKGKNLLGSLKDVVASWEAVGPELKPEEKEQVAAIQGPATTALVHELKTQL